MRPRLVSASVRTARWLSGCSWPIAADTSDLVVEPRPAFAALSSSGTRSRISCQDGDGSPWDDGGAVDGRCTGAVPAAADCPAAALLLVAAPLPAAAADATGPDAATPAAVASVVTVRFVCLWL